MCRATTFSWGEFKVPSRGGALNLSRQTRDPPLMEADQGFRSYTHTQVQTQIDYLREVDPKPSCPSCIPGPPYQDTLRSVDP